MATQSRFKELILEVRGPRFDLYCRIDKALGPVEQWPPPYMECLLTKHLTWAGCSFCGKSGKTWTVSRYSFVLSMLVNGLAPDLLAQWCVSLPTYLGSPGSVKDVSDIIQNFISGKLQDTKAFHFALGTYVHCVPPTMREKMTLPLYVFEDAVYHDKDGSVVSNLTDRGKVRHDGNGNPVATLVKRATAVPDLDVFGRQKFETILLPNVWNEARRILTGFGSVKGA